MLAFSTGFQFSPTLPPQVKGDWRKPSNPPFGAPATVSLPSSTR